LFAARESAEPSSSISQSSILNPVRPRRRQ
jgi:hypothetical protein